MRRDALAQKKPLLAEPEVIRIDRFTERHFNCQIGYKNPGPGVLGCTVFNTNGSVKVAAISNRLDDGTDAGSAGCGRPSLRRKSVAG
jgi:hypothetical protein